VRDWGRDATLRMGQGAAEDWTEEQPLVASRVKVESCVRGGADLRDGIVRLEKRIDHLGTSPPRRRSPN
jgi:ubiquinone biosynthesis protein UbiJ